LVRADDAGEEEHNEHIERKGRVAVRGCARSRMLRLAMNGSVRADEDTTVRRRELLVRALLGALSSLSLMDLAACRPTIMPRSVGHRLVGAPAPRFERTSVSMRDVGIPGSDRTRVTVVDFWASWCEACQQTIPTLDDIWRSKRRDGVMVIGVSVDETEA
jgi:thiol-disulfide isomerase/thioredoxin